jgi:hypothetical protein
MQHAERPPADLLGDAAKPLVVELGARGRVVAVNVSNAGCQEVDVGLEEVVDLGGRGEQG